MNIKDIKRKVLAKIDESNDEIIKLVQDMIKIPSEAYGEMRGGKYVSFSNLDGIIEFVTEHMKEYGLEVEQIPSPTKGWEIPIGRFKSSLGKPKLLLYGHLDTVPAGPREAWSFDPFCGDVKEGKIFGRGAADNKGNFATALILPKILGDVGVKLKGELIICGTLDEEIGCANGTTGIAYAVKEGLIKPDIADMAIYIDGSLEGIGVYSMGVLWLNITTYGTPVAGHGIDYSINPINKMAKIITILSEQLYPVTRKKKTKIPVVPPTPDHGTLNCAIINGGFKENAIPHKCTMVVERRLIPEETLEEVKKQITDAIEGLKRMDPELKVEITERLAIPPALTPNYKQQPHGIALAKAIKEVRGVTPKFLGSAGFNPDRPPFVLDLKIPVLGHASFHKRYPAWGKDSEFGGNHATDEFNTIKNIIDATKIHALTILDLLG